MTVIDPLCRGCDDQGVSVRSTQFPKMRSRLRNDIQCLSGCRVLLVLPVRCRFRQGFARRVFPIRDIALMRANGTGTCNALRESKQAFPPRATCLLVSDLPRRGNRLLAEQAFTWRRNSYSAIKPLSMRIIGGFQTLSNGGFPAVKSFYWIAWAAHLLRRESVRLGIR